MWYPAMKALSVAPESPEISNFDNAHISV